MDVPSRSHHPSTPAPAKGAGGPATRLRRARERPRSALRVAVALLRGRLAVAYHRGRGRRVTAGRNFKLFGRLRIAGPGRVEFGDNCVLRGLVTPFTYRPEAVIRVGSGTMMNNARFGCARSITIGRDCIIAESRIFDTDFHSTRPDRGWNPDAPVRVAPVEVGDNVWIGELAALLPGTRIGANSVVSFGAICMREYPPDKILVGNPAKVAMPIPAVEAEAPMAMVAP